MTSSARYVSLIGGLLEVVRMLLLLCFFIFITGLFHYSHLMLMVDGTDRCFLSSGYLYHAWESIFAIFGRA